MSSDQWAHDVLAQLARRDGIEQHDRRYFAAFKQLADKFEGVPVEETAPDFVDRLNQLALQNDKLEEQLRAGRSASATLERQLAAAQNKVKSLTLELAQKNKSIEMVNDELLSLNIQQNVLSQRVVALEKENETLVQRWMDKAKQDAEKLNDANEFLQNLNLK